MIIVDSPITGKRETLTQSEFNSYMAQTNGAVLKWIIPSKEVNKFNPNHDELGRFATGNGYSGQSTKEADVINRITNVHDGGSNIEEDGTGYHTFRADYTTPSGKVVHLEDNHWHDEIDRHGNLITHVTVDATTDTGNVGNMVFTLHPKGGSYAIIDSISVDESMKRQGIATAMLAFARNNLPSGVALNHSFSLSDEAKSWSDVVKYNPNHDELGRFSPSSGGGHTLTTMDVYRLQISGSDLQAKALYRAEYALHPNYGAPHDPPPKSPRRTDFENRDEYMKAFRKYTDAHYTWERSITQHLLSDAGRKYLDGTRAGVEKYYREVIGQDWFKKAFGDGGVIGFPKIVATSANVQGRYSIGMKKGVPYNAISISKGNLTDEGTLVHELAHYANAISLTKPYEGHGAEFAKNHLYITSKLSGHEYATKLENSYKAEGVKIGD